MIILMDNAHHISPGAHNDNEEEKREREAV